MCETIGQLFNGKLDPSAEMLKPDTEYYGFIEKMGAIEEKLKEVLSEEHHNLFMEYMEVRNNYGYMMNEESFIQGYKLGAKITMETFK